MKIIVTQNTESKSENTKLGRGALVSVKLASGAWVQRRVWSEEDAVVYLCSERLYADLLIGASRLSPIGFPKTDVRDLSEASAA